MNNRLKFKIKNRLLRVYGKNISEEWINDFISFIEKKKNNLKIKNFNWDEKKVFLITYGDVLKNQDENPLQSLYNFSVKHLKGIVSTIHILPFFPYSSDDGFSIQDFYAVNPELGDWKEIEKLNAHFEIMADLVANHASSKGVWFNQFLNNEDPGKNYFFVPPDNFDITKVIRPRSSSLLTEFETSEGIKKVWTTFSTDQADLNYSNPEVLKEMLSVFLFYMSKGINVIRLDAIAFLWKTSGTACMHEPETHEIVRLFRDVMDYCYPGSLLLTETNVPHKENITYFGLGDEAHLIYQFALPPLILHALHTGNGHYLTHWAKELNDPRKGMTYLNFTSSHDGIGVRPLEGIMPEEEKMKMINKLKEYGALITSRKLGNIEVPYEINITFFDALSGTKEGLDKFTAERFIMSQTIMLSLQGIPAFYFLNLFGIPNYMEGVTHSGINRSINRKKFKTDELDGLLEKDNEHQRIFDELMRLTSIRTSMHAFSPDTQQLILDLGEHFFGILRKTDMMDDSVVCVFNLSNKIKQIILPVGLLEFNYDVITDQHQKDEVLVFMPYQSMWLTTTFNKNNS